MHVQILRGGTFVREYPYPAVDLVGAFAIGGFGVQGIDPGPHIHAIAWKIGQQIDMTESKMLWCKT